MNKTTTSRSGNSRFRAVLLLFFLPYLAGVRAESDESYSIVLDKQTEIVCKSPTQAVRKQRYTVTVLQPKGLDAAHFFCACDMFQSLQKFSGEITDASGRTLRKIKKSDLSRTEYSPEFSSDDYYYYYECNVPSYPFTVHYEWEVKHNDNLIGFPAFVPQTDYFQTVLHARYRLELAAGQTCRYREIRTAGTGIRVEQSETADGRIVVEAVAGALPPVVPEPFGPTAREVFPYVYFVPDRFVYSRTEGSLESWTDFGKWQYGLLDGRDLLPEAFRTKLHELTAGCRTDREKVRAVYDYLAANTRYVSIQLGIGGLQPISAESVCRTGFGDCKGLSNLARAMLKELGIPSRYTIIHTERKRLLDDFASADQMNHAILQVPLPGDTLWLECTNARLPFGFVHSRIAGHDALLIGPEGGTVCRLPAYSDSLNTQCKRATVRLAADGTAEIDAEETSRLFQYEDLFGLSQQEPNRQNEIIRSGINLPQARIDGIRFQEKKEALPEITIGYTIRSDRYGHKTGNRLFMPANIFRKGFEVPNPTPRRHPVYVRYGYLDTDSIQVKLPDGFSIEGLPEPTRFESPFGTFESSVLREGSDLLIVHRLLMREGVYEPEQYRDFLDFRKKVSEQYNGKIILKKE